MEGIAFATCPASLRCAPPRRPHRCPHLREQGDTMTTQQLLRLERERRAAGGSRRASVAGPGQRSERQAGKPAIKKFEEEGPGLTADAQATLLLGLLCLACGIW